MLRGYTLKESGRLSKAGVLFVACAALLLFLVGHSLFIQYHQYRATSALTALEFPRFRSAYSSTERQLASAAAIHLASCSRFGLVDTVDWNMKSAWVHRVLAEPGLVEKHLRRALALDPAQPAAHFNLGKELARQGRSLEAARSFDEAVRLAPSLTQFLPARALQPESDAATAQ
jgi:Flp pilus assembly protein TadD